MSSCGDSDRSHEHLGVSQTNRAKKKKSRRFIDHEAVPGAISSAPEHISHDNHLFVVPFGTAIHRARPLATVRCYGRTPPLTQRFVHPGVSPSSTTTPTATPNDETPALAPGQKDRLGRIMIESDGSS
ncbi:hypothetical protein MTR67_007146 [Solanum verrucosum]|uniref:Uncharacterized protein n=1 Tax=Solanum verrucosum TaxID=315347 RepID=A0AAF0TCH1_SOLVR|nr:hypothetical protein MTR67_007146 [Solanum verrucosum]